MTHEGFEKVDDVYLIKHSRNGYDPGWYFADETLDLHGPFSTKEEAEQLLAKYIEQM